MYAGKKYKEIDNFFTQRDADLERLKLKSLTAKFTN